jgi:hypothetical protein
LRIASLHLSLSSFGAQGLGCRVKGCTFQGLSCGARSGLGLCGSEFDVSGVGSRIQGQECRVRVKGFGLRVHC